MCLDMFLFIKSLIYKKKKQCSIKKGGEKVKDIFFTNWWWRSMIFNGKLFNSTRDQLSLSNFSVTDKYRLFSFLLFHLQQKNKKKTLQITINKSLSIRFDSVQLIFPNFPRFSIKHEEIIVQVDRQLNMSNVIKKSSPPSPFTAPSKGNKP